MRRRGMLLGLVGTTALFALGGCQTGFKRFLRFRLTVEVMTPQGLKTGSSVYEIMAVPTYDPTLDKAPYATVLKGQATIIDLPDGPVFVLATGTENIQQATLDALNGNKEPAMNDYVATIGRLGREHVRADLPRTIALPSRETRSLWPKMVRFRDINDPKSVEEVDPDAIGVKRIWVETTSDPVTTGIEKRLVWIDRLEAETSKNILATSGGQILDGLRRK